MMESKSDRYGISLVAGILAAATVMLGSACQDEEPMRPSADGTMLLHMDEPDPTLAMTDTGKVAALPSIEDGALKSGGGVENANVLVWKQYPINDAVIARLRGLGHTVTVSSALPSNLGQYDVIWHFGAIGVPSAQERTRLASFLSGGGGLHITGERPCCDNMNDSWDAFVASVVIGGANLTIGRQGDIQPVGGGYGSPYVINQNVQAQVATTPNQVDTLYLPASGGIAGLTSTAHILARGQGGVPVGAIWDSGDLVGNAGRLSLLMDVNWASHTWHDDEDNPQVLENLQFFLQGGAQNGQPIADAGADQGASCLIPGSDVAVNLDGTGSSDPDGDSLSYSWYQGGVLIATGATPTVYLAPGDHEITLVVNDGDCDSEPDSVQISLESDAEPPILTVLGNDPETVECGDAYHDAGATAEDVCSGDLTDAIVTTSDVDSSTVGSYSVEYQVTDDAGLSAQAARTVIVEDTTPPTVEVQPMLELWPPNHAYHQFTLDDCVAEIEDACTPLGPDFGHIDAIYSDEPENSIGDGNTEDDIVILDHRTFMVRAERRGNGDGRVYGVHFTVSDDAGNATSATCYIGVPHDQSGTPAVDSGPSYTVLP